MKKIFLFCFSILLFCQIEAQLTSVWDGNVATVFQKGAGTDTDPYQIQNASELALLSKNINERYDTMVSYYKLMTDIDLNNLPWTPVGGNFKNAFRGVFEGNNKTITNLKIVNNATLQYAGLFGRNEGIVKNLTVKNGYIRINNKYSPRVGAIAGSNFGTIRNCMAYSVTCISGAQAGGIAGSNETPGLVEHSVVIGKSGDTILSLYGPGGIVGLNTGVINNCYNRATVIASDIHASAGIAGASTVGGVVKNSYNAGTLIGVNTGDVVGDRISSIVSNCYAIKGPQYTQINGILKTEAQMKAVDFVQELNGQQTEKPWMVDNNAELNQGFPILLWQNNDAKVTIKIVQPEHATIKVFVQGVEVANGDQVPFMEEARFLAMPDSNYRIDYYTANDTLVLGKKVRLSKDLEISARTLHTPGIKSWDGTIAKGYQSGEGTMENPYIIASPQQLAYLSKQVASKIDYMNTFFKLTVDIDLNFIDWTPIGITDEVSFVGVFDGSDHTIANLYMDRQAKYSGLFGHIGRYDGVATINNLGIVGNGLVKGSSFVGGIVGLCYNSYVYFCYNQATIIGINEVGGVTGFNRACYILSSYNEGSISGERRVGGVAGGSYSGALNNCYNMGPVTAQESAAGIIVGNSGKLFNSYNVGKVTAEVDFGAIGSYDGDVNVDNCYYETTSCIFSGSGQARSATYMKSLEFVDLLNIVQLEELPWKQDVQGINQYYPIIFSQVYRLINFPLDQSAYAVEVLDEGSIDRAFIGKDYKFKVNLRDAYNKSDILVSANNVQLFPKEGVYTIPNIQRDQKIEIGNIKKNTYTITVNAAENGKINPGTLTVIYGENATFTIIPDSTFAIVNVAVDSINKGIIANYLFSNVTRDHSISATFAKGDYLITVIDTEHGAITPKTIMVRKGDSITMNITPEKEYSIKEVTVDGTSVGQNPTYTFKDIRENHTITATYFERKFTITVVQPENARITPETIVVAYGANITFKITPEAGYQIEWIELDGRIIDAGDTVWTLKNITADHQFSASTLETGRFLITASAGIGGSISPGNTRVPIYTNQTFTFTPSVNYVIQDVKVDNVSQGVIFTYEFTNVVAPHNIIVAFSPKVNIEEETLSEVKIYTKGHTIYIENQTIKNAEYQILDIAGRSIQKGIFTSPNMELQLNRSGLYMLRIYNSDKQVLRKIVL